VNEITKLEDLMRQMPQVELETTHYFARGLYGRAVARKAGTLIVGKVHKQEHFYIVTKGKVQIEDQVYEAGTVLISQPGTKRAVLALEDSICMTVHHTFRKNLEKLEHDLVVEDPKALYGVGNTLKELPCPS
jgi:hypothetical protein